MNRKGLRTTAVLVGVALALIAILADRIGLDRSKGFDFGQLLLLVAGLMIIAVGLLGRRSASWYQIAATSLVTALLLIGAMEFALRALSTLSHRQLDRGGIVDRLQEHYLRLEYYAEQEWSELFWRETQAASGNRYEPYVVWRALPFDGETLRIDTDGWRVTPESVCEEDSLEIFVFGGSTIWGSGAPDWETIPAHLQRGFEKLERRPVCVRNFGQSGYVSTQSLLTLEALIQAGRLPDVAIFYDGVNDVFAAHQSGEPFVHQNLAQIESLLNSPKTAVSRWLADWKLARLGARWLGHRDRTTEGLWGRGSYDSEELAAAVVEAYLSIVDIGSSLAEHYGIEAFFFWQPYVVEGNKPLSTEESEMLGSNVMELTIDHRLRGLSHEIYDRVESAAVDRDRLFYLADVFDQIDETIWIDTWGHVVPPGNQIVAERMVELITNLRRDSRGAEDLQVDR